LFKQLLIGSYAQQLLTGTMLPVVTSWIIPCRRFCCAFFATMIGERELVREGPDLSTGLKSSHLAAFYALKTQNSRRKPVRRKMRVRF
jgi:hypothetical protein